MKEKTLIKLLAICSLVAGVIAFAMMFFPAIKLGSEDPATIKGTELAFGKNQYSIDAGVLFKGSIDIKFSFGVCLAYFAPLAAALLVGLVELLSNKKGSKFIFGIAAFALFACGILFIATIRKTAVGEITTTLLGKSSTTAYNFESWDLATQSIIAMVFTVLGLCTSGTYTVLQLLKGSKKR